jgi:RNA 2',3'-cyclic 3'-phosphodiesterase
MRFSAKDGQFPFVLCADTATTESALQLRKAIAAAQSCVGLQVSGVSSFLPHVTLLKGNAVDAIEESITSIHWHVHEFVLIRSFFGQSRHEVIGRWPLAIEPKPEMHDLLAEMASMPELPGRPDEE